MASDFVVGEFGSDHVTKIPGGFYQNPWPSLRHLEMGGCGTLKARITGRRLGWPCGF